jgi:quercetin dioxygenase-like cupin family protein
MLGYHILFESMKWENPQEGVYQKIYSKGDKRMRLLKFTESFVEDDWCTKGHIGYVLSGEMEIDFNGEVKSYIKGDGLWIEEEESKHKVSIKKGNQVELILFESE